MASGAILRGAGLLLAALAAAAGCRPAAVTSPAGGRPAPAAEPRELPRGELAAAAYLAGQEAELDELPEVAAECYRRAVELDPEVAEYRARLGLALAAAGRPAEAGPHLEAAERLGARSFAVLQSLADHHLRAGQREAAVRCFERLMSSPELAEKSATPEAAVLRPGYFLMGHYVGARRPGEAARVAALLAARFPERPEFRLEQARHLLAAEAEAQALEALAEFERLMPASSAGARMLALHYSDRGLYAQALERAEAAAARLAAEPGTSAADTARMRYLRADLLGRLRRFREAREELAALLAAAEDDAARVEALVALAYLDRSEGRPAEAVRRLEAALAGGLSSGRLWAALAAFHEESGRADAAAAACRRALEFSPDDVRYRCTLARLLESQGRRPEAAEELRVALRGSPRDAEASCQLGRLYALEGINLEEASDLVAAALRAQPTNGRYLDAEGWVRYRQGRVKEALDLLESAALRAPGAEVYEHLGDACYALGFWARARRAWQRALELEPGRAGTGRRLERLGGSGR